VEPTGTGEIHLSPSKMQSGKMH